MTGNAGTAGTLTHHHARWAWIWLALTPLGVLGGLVVLVMTFNVLGVDWTNPDQAAWWENAVATLAALVPIATPPALGLFTGLRAMHDGSTSGRVAAYIAGALLAVLVGWILWTVVVFESAA